MQLPFYSKFNPNLEDQTIHLLNFTVWYIKLYLGKLHIVELYLMNEEGLLALKKKFFSYVLFFLSAEITTVKISYRPMVF